MESYVKFLRGTPSAYNGLTNKDPNTLYFVSETNSSSGILYLGTKVITSGGGGPGGATSLSDLSDVFFQGELKGKSFLVYENGHWTNKTAIDVVTDIIPKMTGATASSPGSPGIVPGPAAGDHNKYLRGDGTWVTVTGSIGQDTIDKIDKLVTDVANLEEVVAGLDSSKLEIRVGNLEKNMVELTGNYESLTTSVNTLENRLKWQDIVQ